MWGGLAPLPLRLGGNRTDGWPATDFARFTADLPACVRTSVFARLTYTKSGATIVVTAYDGMHGKGIPAAPTSVVNGTGDVTWTWASSYIDAYSTRSPTNIRGGKATCHGVASKLAVVEIVSANSIRVRTFVMSSGAAVDADVSVRVR